MLTEHIHARSYIHTHKNTHTHIYIYKYNLLNFVVLKAYTVLVRHVRLTYGLCEHCSDSSDISDSSDSSDSAMLLYTTMYVTIGDMQAAIYIYIYIYSFRDRSGY